MPTLRVGTHGRDALRPFNLASRQHPVRDAERPDAGSHAERGNQVNAAVERLESSLRQSESTEPRAKRSSAGLHLFHEMFARIVRHLLASATNALL